MPEGFSNLNGSVVPNRHGDAALFLQHRAGSTAPGGRQKILLSLFPGSRGSQPRSGGQPALPRPTPARWEQNAALGARPALAVPGGHRRHRTLTPLRTGALVPPKPPWPSSFHLQDPHFWSQRVPCTVLVVIKGAISLNCFFLPYFGGILAQVASKTCFCVSGCISGTYKTQKVQAGLSYFSS